MGGSRHSSINNAGGDCRWTPRQREVLGLLARGLTNGEIARELEISLDGAKYHVSEILSKLGANSRDEAAIYWRREQCLPERIARISRRLNSVPAAVAGATGLTLVVVMVLAIVVVAPRDPKQPSSGSSAPSDIDAGDVEVAIAAGESRLNDHRFSSEGGYLDGLASEARFQGPIGITFDPAGNLLVADAGNHRVRAVSPGGTVTTIAGSGDDGVRNGPAPEAWFRNIVDIAPAPDGSIYVVDAGADMIRRISPEGMVETAAGVDYVACSAEVKQGEPAPERPAHCPERGQPRFRDGAVSGAVLREPSALVVASDGTVYFTDSGNFRIRYITSDGIVGTLAGNGSASITDGRGGEAGFLAPTDIVLGPDQHLYVTDGVVIRRVSLDGVVETIAGDPTRRVGGYEDGPVGEALFSSLGGLSISPEGVICVADGQRIRRIADGYVSTIAGTGEQGFQLGSGDVATLSLPLGVARSPDGALLVADMNHSLLLSLSVPGSALC